MWEGLQGTWFPKAWGRHWQGHPGPRLDWFVRICAQQAWAKMGALQSMDRDGARELRGGVGAVFGQEEAKPRTVPVCAEKGPEPDHWAAKPGGLALPPQCSQGFMALCLGTHHVPLSTCPALLPDFPADCM